MRRIGILVGFGLAVLAAAGANPLAEPVSERFVGTYDWNEGASDRLTVRFTPDGEGVWKVDFEFLFDGDTKRWKGTATGPLTDGGELSGAVSSGGRSWVFRASLRNGVLRGTHAEIRRGVEAQTGTFELRR